MAGPLQSVEKAVTYEVATPGQRRSKWTLHVNLIKEWFARLEDNAGF